MLYIKTKQFQTTPMTTYASEDVEKGKHFYTAGGSANSYSHFGDQYGGSSGKWE